MSVDLTCPACAGRATHDCDWPGCPIQGELCGACNGSGRRRPELHEWNALVADRDDWEIYAALIEEERDRLQGELNDALRRRRREPVSFASLPNANPAERCTCTDCPKHGEYSR